MNKDKNVLIYAIIAAIIITVIIVIILVKKTQRKKIKKEIDELYIRFNEIKTIPLAFKLNKAQTIAKRNEQMASSVQNYYKKYEDAEKHINQIQEMLNNADDQAANRKYSETKKALTVVSENITDCEKEVKEIDNFLEGFSKKESEQRDFSSKLKEDYRVVKTTINKNSNVLSFAYDGLMKKLQDCEELFSSSEEMMYASDYTSAQDCLEKIQTNLDNIKTDANAAPRLVKDIKGVLPLMIDEAKREYALTRQRGVNVAHLNVDDTLSAIEKDLKINEKKLSLGEMEGVRDNVDKAKDTLNDLTDSLATENRSYKEAKTASDKVWEHINDLSKVENYVRIAYDKDSARFGLQDLKPLLKKQRDSIEIYKQEYKDICEKFVNCDKPASLLLRDVEDLDKRIDADIKSLYSYKLTIDKSTDAESRAISQLTKLQLVVSEVESKIALYNLPSIASSYKDDLLKSREYIANIRKLSGEIPINIEELNSVLDEGIDFIFKFYNNANNIVGMAVMVENAIVFGNKYRSSYSDIDQKLSKAEFQYLNGEYTKAFKTVITSLETLFPGNVDEKILENI